MEGNVWASTGFRKDVKMRQLALAPPPILPTSLFRNTTVASSVELAAKASLGLNTTPWPEVSPSHPASQEFSVLPRQTHLQLLLLTHPLACKPSLPTKMVHLTAIPSLVIREPVLTGLPRTGCSSASCLPGHTGRVYITRAFNSY